MGGLHIEWPADARPLIIGLAGGSGSGKSTIAAAIVDSIGATNVALIEHDAYYCDLSAIPFEERVKVNYDHPDSLETTLLVHHLETLRRGMPIDKPVYDFSSHTRSSEVVKVLPTDVILVEGILVLVEEQLRSIMDLKLYVDTDSDLRLMRRLQRDISERGRTVESVIAQYQQTVRPMHVQFVEPSKRHADMIIPEGYNPMAVGTVISMIRDFLVSATP